MREHRQTPHKVSPIFGRSLAWQRLTTGLQVRPSWQDDLRSQCLVGLHHGCWQAVSWGINSPCCSCWSLPSRRTKAASVGRWHGWCSFCMNAGVWTACMTTTVTRPTCYKYVLRSRRHDYSLSIETDYDDRNFITRLLYKDMYWLFSRYFLLYLIYCISCVLTTFY